MWNQFCAWAASERSLRTLLFIVIALRLIVLGIPALTDPSEARYAVVAQRMVDSGQWLIPEVDQGLGFEPFWGKPPLHFWLTAASFTVFGFSEWAARLPSFLCSLVITGVLFQFAAVFHSRAAGYLTALIAFSSISFLLFSGASMTDMTLTCCTTCAAMSFALGALSSPRRKIWMIVFFLFLALGMITKGPIAIAFPCGAIVIWMLLTKQFGILREIPWIPGIAVFLAVAVPWFVIAESATPGLNKYFFVNENFLRFISRDYDDKYGSAHPRFRGTIWLYLLAGFIPWSLFLLVSGRSFLKYIKDQFSQRFASASSRVVLFAALTALVPMLFFTAARSIIFTYALPAIPAMTVLTALFILRGPHAPDSPEIVRRSGVFSAVAALIGGLILVVFVASSPFLDQSNSDRGLVEFVRSRSGTGDLFFVKKFPYSTVFYGTNGSGPRVASALVKDGEEAAYRCGYIAIPRKHAPVDRVKFAAPKAVHHVETWELLEFDPCSPSAPNPAA